MNIISTNSQKITTTKSFPGLIEAKLEHVIQSSSGDVQYKGPPIDPEAWSEILAFFQWSYDTTHSETQVRLFVNTETKVWKGWAFPQEARTSMSAKELPDVPDTKEQRAQFNESKGWVYFGTVHHHCGMSAFQSGTDRENEQGIDGLHITIGSMGSARYDLHARFYLGGFCFEPNMAKFWNIGDQLTKLLPPDLWDKVARHQMCEKAPKDAGFPDQWKANLIEVKRTFPESASTAAVTQGFSTSHFASSPMGAPVWLRARRALGELALSLDHPYSAKEQKELCDYIRNANFGKTILSELLDLLDKYNLTISDMWDEIPPQMTLSSHITTYKTQLADAPAKPAVALNHKERVDLEDWRYGMME